MSPRKTNIWHRGEVFQTYGMLSCTISLTLCLQESFCTSPITMRVAGNVYTSVKLNDSPILNGTDNKEITAKVFPVDSC